MGMDREKKDELARLIQEKEKRLKYNFIKTIFPDSGPLRRELYPKHIAFLNAGANYTERAFIAGNRVGKTLTGCYELVIHATGLYPDWWEGKRFAKPVSCWVAGDRGETIRDSIQKVLLGNDGFDKGTGLIPKHLIISTPAMSGVPGAVGQYNIRHTSGGTSNITVKTYQAGKNAFEAAAIDVIMLDEECPQDIYVECMVRTLTTKGTVYLTFTPDSGLTDTVMHFFKKDKNGPEKFVTMVGWNDVPHISPQDRERLLASIPPHMRDVKTKGVPYLGKGAIYPVPEEDILVKPFEIPRYWPRAYGLDIGWDKTAAVWCAQDRDTGIYYLYSEYKKGEEKAPVHAASIKARGEWIEGVIDKASRGRSQADGERLIDEYTKLGLVVYPSVQSKVVESGIFKIYDLLSTGRLKIFSTLQEWIYEYRIYRRDDNGKVAPKQDDHLMDATRYLIDMFQEIAKTEPVEEDDDMSYSRNTNSKSFIGGY